MHKMEALKWSNKNEFSYRLFIEWTIKPETFIEA